MATLIKAMDWARTPLGPIDSWPQSLRTVLSLAQASSSPISLAWGPEHTQIYNDGYWPICGEKHPESMGQDFRECWASAFPVIGEAYNSAWTGQTAYLENMRMFLDRYGFLEETWFTFSFSPITDESGQVAGVFHPVTELTSQSLSDRRTRVLSRLAGRVSEATDSQQAFDCCSTLFADAALDMPFALVYLLDDAGRFAKLVAGSGIPRDSTLSPGEIDIELAGAGAWPIAEALRSRSAQRVDGLARQLSGMTIGPYPELPDTALVLPLNPSGDERAGVLVAGISSRLELTESYRHFLDLVAASVSATLANARAHEHQLHKAEQLEAINRAKTEFFSNVSHEFRTPLTLMLGPLEDELREGDTLGPARRERLETAHRSSLRLLKLVNTLLDFSRGEAGRLQASFRPTDLARLTIDLAEDFRSTLERGGLTLQVDCPPLPEQVYVDHEMWETIVLNLLSNAFKHTFDGGISVQLRWLGKSVQLMVRDTGVGIAADETSRLFDRFHRVAGAPSRTHEGTGIGLSMVKDLVRLHGGEITVDSEPAGGSCFTVHIAVGTRHLPVDQVDGQDDEPAIRTGANTYLQEANSWLSSEREPTTNGATKRPRVLWADDNADMRNYVTRLLSSTYDVTPVGDGATALEAALADPPDLVLSDVMMPGLDGFGLVRALRADERTERLPVILLSARAGEEASVDGLDVGADDYVVKPFAARELLARIRSSLAMVRLRNESEARLLDASQQLQRLNAELQQADELKSQFLAMAAHELRTPLTAISGFTKTLLKMGDQFSEEDKRGFLEIIDGQSDRLAHIVDDLLMLSKIEAGALTMTPAPIDVALAIKQTIRELGAAEVTVSCGTSVRAFADTQHVQQILTNYVGNAIKYGAAPITVQAKRIDGHVEICVCDQGDGVPEEFVPRLFERFARACGDVNIPGTGLGLSIVRGLAQAQGGDAWYQPNEPSGSRFYVRLPLAAL